MGGPAINWHDDWINEHHGDTKTYKELSELYNKIFNTNIGEPAFRNHCYLKLRIKKQRNTRKRYTEEQIQFLKENYAKMGN